jgi:cell division protease FtsH
VRIRLPDLEGRRAVLAVHAKGKPFAPNVNFDGLAKRTVGMSGADLANVINEAALLTARENATLITEEALEESVDRVVGGPRRKGKIISEQEKKITAYHEGGHALLATVLQHADEVHKVTILPTGMALGVTQTMPEERHAYSRDHLLDRICMTMGGRVAEELVFNQRTTGAANDLEVATRVAKRMVREWGMSDRIGPMAWESQGQVFLGEDLMTGQREYSDDTARLIDEEVARILREQEDRARALLTKHRRGLDLVAKSLLEKETIEGSDVAALVQEGLTPEPIPTPSA